MIPTDKDTDFMGNHLSNTTCLTSRRDKDTDIGGNHLSNTACLTQANTMATYSYP